MARNPLDFLLGTKKKLYLLSLRPWYKDLHAEFDRRKESGDIPTVGVWTQRRSRLSNEEYGFTFVRFIVMFDKSFEKHASKRRRLDGRFHVLSLCVFLLFFLPAACKTPVVARKKSKRKEWPNDEKYFFLRIFRKVCLKASVSRKISCFC